MLDSSGKITKNYKLMGTESDPVIIAQRLLNLYRQLHIFSPEKKEAYNKMLIEQPLEVKRLIGTLPGGVVVQQYLADIEKEAGISDEGFEQVGASQDSGGVQSYSADTSAQEQPRVVVQSATSPDMAREIAKAFKEALVSSDKNRKEDTKELAQTLVALQSKLTQAILEKQNKNTTQSQSELIKTITHTQTQEFSAIISQALKEIRQMSNDALVEAIQKVHTENLDFFKNQIFSTVSPMPMSAHYDAKMQEFHDKYNEADDAISLDEYAETPSPVKETAVDDISEDDYYQEMSKHEAEPAEKEEEKEPEEEIDESLLEGFDGNPEDLFENDTEWKTEKEETKQTKSEEEKVSPQTTQIKENDKGQDESEETTKIEETAKQTDGEKAQTELPTDINQKETIEQTPSKEDAENDEDYEWEYVDEEENPIQEEQSFSVQQMSDDSPQETNTQATYNILESVDDSDNAGDEYEWEYVEEEGDSEASEENAADEDYEWEYVEDDDSETVSGEEYDYDEDPYNPNSNTNNTQEYFSANNKGQYKSQVQSNDNIATGNNLGISSNDDN